MDAIVKREAPNGVPVLRMHGAESIHMAGRSYAETQVSVKPIIRGGSSHIHPLYASCTEKKGPEMDCAEEDDSRTRFSTVKRKTTMQG